MTETVIDTPACPQIRRRVIGSNVWLLSFGDLVTLMLGFFVAIIAYALQHPPPQGASQESKQHGIPIAEVPPQVAAPAFRQVSVIPAVGFEQESGEILEKWRNQLKEQLNLKVIEVEQATVSSCIGSVAGDWESIRFAVMGRTLAVASQVLDIGLPGQLLRVEAPGESCEVGLEAGGVSVTIVGKPVK